jgi:hypothetical protein
MTKQKKDEILSYVAENFISPLCDSKKSGKELFLQFSEDEFNKFVTFVNNLAVSNTMQQYKRLEKIIQSITTKQTRCNNCPLKTRCANQTQPAILKDEPLDYCEETLFRYIFDGELPS